MPKGELHVQLDVNYADDPKLSQVSRLARLLYVDALTLCKRTLNDGVLTVQQIKKLGYPSTGAAVMREAAELVASGAWRFNTEDGTYTVVAWLKRNKSRAEVAAEQADRGDEDSEKGSYGNHVRWHVDRGVTKPGCKWCTSPEDRQWRSGGDTHDGNGSITSPENSRGEPLTPNRVDAHHAGVSKSKGSVVEALSQVGALHPSPDRSPPDRPASRPGIANHRSETETETETRTRPPVARETHVPQRVADLAATAHSVAAHRLVEAYAATCATRPPSAVLTALAVQADQLLAEHIPSEHIAAGLDLWGAKPHLSPRLLPQLVHEAVNARPATTGQANTLADKAVGWLALGQPEPATPPLRALPGGAS